MKKIIATILSFILLFSIISTVPVMAANSDIDITSSTVRADLASMGEDKLSFVSDSHCIFIAMSQYYDLNGNLRSYLYFNLPTWAAKYQDGLCVSISTAVSDANYNITENFTNYDLQFVNKESTWYKFEILDLPNVEQTTRRYNISEIITKEAQTSLEFYVDETYIFHGIENDTIEVFNQEIETITITDKEVHFYCYGDTMNFFFQDTGMMNPGDVYTDAWYIFFNTDKKIDQLLEIELTYTQYDYHFYRSSFPTVNKVYTEEAIEDLKSDFLSDFSSGQSYVNYHDPTVTTILPGKTKVSYTDNGWFGSYDTYYEELDNIMDLRSYKAKDSDNFVFTEYADRYTWGVHFKDTQKSFERGGSDMFTAINLDGSGMSDVAILRLKFQTNGIVKNCYAVDTPTDDFTGSGVDVETKFEKLFEKLFSIVALLALVVFFGFLTPVFKFLFDAFVAILKLLFSPFRWIFGGRK